MRSLRFPVTTACVLIASAAFGQSVDLSAPFRDLKVGGSITILDYRNGNWIYSDEKDADVQTSPASTFKILNSLIALEDGVIPD